MTDPQPFKFSASDWLREHLTASVQARANVEEYTQIDVIVSEPGKPDRKGTGWTVDVAVARAVGETVNEAGPA